MTETETIEQVKQRFKALVDAGREGLPPVEMPTAKEQKFNRAQARRAALRLANSYVYGYDSVEAAEFAEMTDTELEAVAQLMDEDPYVSSAGLMALLNAPMGE